MSAELALAAFGGAVAGTLLHAAAGNVGWAAYCAALGVAAFVALGADLETLP